METPTAQILSIFPWASKGWLSIGHVTYCRQSHSNMRLPVQILSFLALPFLELASSLEQQAFTVPLEPWTPLTTVQHTLADLLTIETSASIFYSYARETEISRLFI